MRKIYNLDNSFLNYDFWQFGNHFTRMLLLLERLQNVIVEVFTVFVALACSRFSSRRVPFQFCTGWEINNKNK